MRKKILVILLTFLIFDVGIYNKLLFGKIGYEKKSVNVCKKCVKNYLWNQIKYSLPELEKQFVIVIASFNNKDWYELNLDSVLSQKYKNYKIIYIDDNSSDGTADLVKKYISLHKDKSDKILLVQNTSRSGAAANIYKAIHTCEDNSIIVILDGDDWFANDHVLSLLNKVYEDPNIWLTYGQFENYPSKEVGYCRMISNDVIEKNSFRNHKWVFSHLRTFYSWLYKKININDLKLETGEFYPTTGDLAIMFPMLEMCHDRFKFIPDVLYIYNRATTLNVYKKDRKTQLYIKKLIRNKKKYSVLNDFEIPSFMLRRAN